MKTVDEARSVVAARLADRNRLTRFLTAPPAELWPWKIPLGNPDKTQLQQQWDLTRDRALAWNRLTLPAGVQVNSKKRLVHGIPQQIPTEVELHHLQAAAEFGGGQTVRRVAAAAQRWQDLQATFPHTATPAILSRILDWSDLDTTILFAAGQWFSHHDPSGLTLRQVPVAGMHSKWLSHPRAQLIAILAGRVDQHGKPVLKLRARLARAVHFHYLDPGHLATGRRLHDTWTPGDTPPACPYPPTLVVICENKDTAVTLTPTSGMIGVEGAGYTGAPAVAALPFLPDAIRVIYWGDIDIDGYIILDRYRAKIPLDSILMDRATYDQYRAFGGDDKDGSKPRSLERLRRPEAEMYSLLCDPTWDGPRRIEQERIPVAAATDLLHP